MKLTVVVLGVFLLGMSQPTHSLSDNLLDFLDVYAYSIKLFGMQYKALISSATAEMNNIENDYIAKVVTRIGFVSQDIKQLEYETMLAIQDRAIEINDFSAQCILQARRSLESASMDAGNVIMGVARNTTNELTMLNGLVVYTQLNEISLLASMFDIEVYRIFADFNSVTNMMGLLLELEMEVRFYGALFEYYVNEVYVQMMIYTQYTNTLSQTTFPALHNAVESFRDAGRVIRESLATCNS